MRIKTIVIEGQDQDVRIERTPSGAAARSADGRVEVDIDRGDDAHARYDKALQVAVVVYGRDTRRGGPAATNSMVHDVLDAIERVASV